MSKLIKDFPSDSTAPKNKQLHCDDAVQCTRLTGNIQGGMTLHPMPPRQSILYRGRQRMPQMQTPRHIRRWNHHDKFLPWGLALRLLGIAGIKTTGLPPILPCGLDGGGVIGIGHGGGRKVFFVTLGGGIYEFWFREGGYRGGSLFGICFVFVVLVGLAPGGFFFLLALVFGEFLEGVFGEFLFWFFSGDCWGCCCGAGVGRLYGLFFEAHGRQLN